MILCDIISGILYLFAISALNVYEILFSGWSSSFKSLYLEALR